ncbi:MAG: GtrA family protein [Anaerolineae bacterium]|nr:GtrA family protein [Anaerolineae bacterium]
MTETTDTQPSTSLIERIKAFTQDKEFERFWKFCVVGTIGAAIDYGTFTALNAVGWFDSVVLHLPFDLHITGVGISGTIALILAVISNFIWNRYWTYPDSRSKPVVGQLIIFFLVNIVGIIIRIPILELLSIPLANLSTKIVPTLAQSRAIWLGESGAWAIAVVIVLFWNFFVNRYWTYNDVD